MNDDSRRAAGMAMRRQVLGSGYVDRQVQGTDDFNESLQDLVVRYCWGEVWTRTTIAPGLRSLLTVSMLIALNRPDELRIHLRGALNNGCTAEELEEVLLQAAIYCGVPAALAACRVMQSVLRDPENAPPETDQR